MHVFVDLEIHGRVGFPHPAVAAGARVAAPGPAAVLVAWLKALRSRLRPSVKTTTGLKKKRHSLEGGGCVGVTAALLLLRCFFADGGSPTWWTHDTPRLLAPPRRVRLCVGPQFRRNRVCGVPQALSRVAVGATPLTRGGRPVHSGITTGLVLGPQTTATRAKESQPRRLL